MATEINCVCDVCHVRHIRSTVREYCLQCDQNLCGDCTEHHRIAKASKAHETIPFEQYKTSHSFIQNIKHRCDKHEHPFEFHCQLHNSLACKRCIVIEHRTCDDVVLLEDVLRRFKSLTASEKLEKSLLDVKSVISTAISKSKDNLKMLPTNENDIVERIKNMRKNINDHFDKLEQDLILKASQSKVKGKRCISRILRDLETENKQVNEISKNIEVLKECASDRQSFIGTRNLEQSLKQIKIQLQKDDFHDVKICCEFDDSFVNTEEAIGSIGNVLPRKVNVGFTLRKIADKAKQTMDIFKIDGVIVEQLERIRVYGTDITACMMIKETLFLNRDMDRHSTVLKFISGNFEGDINLFPASVFDIAYLDEKRVLVTTGDSSKSMKVFDIDQPRAARRHLKMNDSCYGITSNKQVFIFCTDKCIKVLDYDTLSVSNFPAEFEEDEDEDLQETYLTANESNLFLSNYHRDTVTCYDFSGKVVWTFSDKAILNNPRGIALDDQSNIYVAGSMSNNIVTMTSDGKRARELLGLADGLDHPHAIYFYKDDDILVVCNLRGTAFKFLITVKPTQE